MLYQLSYTPMLQEIIPALVRPEGFEPTAYRLKVDCSTNWAMNACCASVVFCLWDTTKSISAADALGSSVGALDSLWKERWSRRQESNLQCGCQRPMPCRLATPRYYRIYKPYIFAHLINLVAGVCHEANELNFEIHISRFRKYGHRKSTHLAFVCLTGAEIL